MTDSQSRNGWFKVPHALIEHMHKMPKSAVLTLLVLMHFADDEGRAWPSINTIQHLAGIRKRTTLWALAWLEQRGFIKRTRRKTAGKGNQSTVYELQPPCWDSATREPTPWFPHCTTLVQPGNHEQDYPIDSPLEYLASTPVDNQFEQDPDEQEIPPYPPLHKPSRASANHKGTDGRKTQVPTVEAIQQAIRESHLPGKWLRTATHLADWFAYLAQRGKPAKNWKQQAVALCELAGTTNTLKGAIHRAIANGWANLYPEREPPDHSEVRARPLTDEELEALNNSADYAPRVGPSSQTADKPSTAEQQGRNLDWGAVVFPAGCDTPEVRNAIHDWLDYHRKIGKPYKLPERQVTLLLARHGAGIVEAIQHSIANGYQGCFAPRQGGNTRDRRYAAGPGQRHPADVGVENRGW